MVHLGSLEPMPDDPLDALTDEDLDWLDRMADVLPAGMVIDGSRLWHLYRFDPWITQEMVRG